ncbi:MAG: DUF2142 domain-containing protein [Chloroflexi bacterium]|nr:DUF2142 domain-containing protein [Chloroflexota bacterium]
MISRLTAAVTLVALVAGGATLTVVRRAWWAPGEVTHRGVFPGEEWIDGAQWRRFRAYGKVEVPDPGWRPLRVSMALAPAPGAPHGDSLVDISIDDRLVQSARVGPGSTLISIRLTDAAATDGRLEFQFRSQVFDEEEHGIAIGTVTVTPEIGAWSLVRFGLPGATAGALLWWLWRWPWPRRPATRPAGAAAPPMSPASESGARRSPRWHAWAAAAVSTAIVLPWVVLKPPMQAPDEPAHLARVLAWPQVPWLSASDEVPVLEQRWNPLASMPPELAALPFQPDHRLTTAQIAALARKPWPDAPGYRQVFTQAWAYPPGFYATVFLAGQPLVWASSATPYQSVYLYRAVVALLAASCWTWLFVALRGAALTDRQRWFVLGVCLANPMVASLSSSVNPDALLVPLLMLAMVYGYRAMVAGGDRGTLLGVLLLAALTKYSALVVMAALAATALLLVLTRRLGWRVATDGLRPVAAAGILMHLTFSMWAPLALYGTPRAPGLSSYWAALVTYGWRRWVSFWGKLGWLDYEGPERLYVALLWLMMANLVLAAPRLAREWRRAEFGAVTIVVSVAFIAGVMAGEYVNLSKTGLTFQGRYVLPALLGVAMMLLASWRAARWAFLAVLLALHVSLAQGSVTRYYGDARTWLTSMPWAAHRDTATAGPRVD